MAIARRYAPIIADDQLMNGVCRLLRISKESVVFKAVHPNIGEESTTLIIKYHDVKAEAEASTFQHVPLKIAVIEVWFVWVSYQTKRVHKSLNGNSVSYKRYYYDLIC